MLTKKQLALVRTKLGSKVAAELEALGLVSESTEPVGDIIDVLLDAAAEKGLTSDGVINELRVHEIVRRLDPEPPPAPPANRPMPRPAPAQVIVSEGLEVPTTFSGRPLSGEMAVTFENVSDRALSLSNGTVIPAGRAVTLRGRIGGGTYNEIRRFVIDGLGRIHAERI